ncbi:MAG: di-trans,poly-cis-decaprenylcistransferase [Proteobacteria bacterium]|nr:di-trans,poly-cis-decaprenylcistransferase [Pseudomonadota bacterium]
MHVAIIMDGNGRWARARSLDRQAGHRAGARAVEAIVRSAARRAIDTLTLYAFSSDNWHRPQLEVVSLLRLMRRFLLTETERCRAESIRVNVIGRRDRLGEALLKQIRHSEEVTAGCARMHLRLAIDYSSRWALMEAARLVGGPNPMSPDEYLACLARVTHSEPVAPAVDLLIRTGGERRLSDFLLWECAYAELLFTDTLWPDFDSTALSRALAEYARRERKFGQLPGIARAAAGAGGLQESSMLARSDHP